MTPTSIIAIISKQLVKGYLPVVCSLSLYFNIYCINNLLCRNQIKLIEYQITCADFIRGECNISIVRCGSMIITELRQWWISNYKFQTNKPWETFRLKSTFVFVTFTFVVLTFTFDFSLALTNTASWMIAVIMWIHLNVEVRIRVYTYYFEEWWKGKKKDVT